MTTPALVRLASVSHDCQVPNQEPAKRRCRNPTTHLMLMNRRTRATLHALVKRRRRGSLVRGPNADEMITFLS